ncbi:hypothetical protein [Candidatus Palauibacter sp.]|uniref:hypothetical protein n=1 Tax=Candidatus Palauibacter sp. TaxID=3101350 RepID=UPI003B599056
MDLRFVNDRKNFDSETRRHAQPRHVLGVRHESNKPNFVRNLSEAARNAPFVSFNMSRIDSWDALILGVNAKGLHPIQFKVIDVNRADAWDWVKGILGGIIESLKYQAKKTIEATQQGDGEDESELVSDKTVVAGSLGGAAADLRSCGFRRVPITDSDPCRSPIPVHADHRFQCMRIGDSDSCRSPWSERVAVLENLL